MNKNDKNNKNKRNDNILDSILTQRGFTFGDSDLELFSLKQDVQSYSSITPVGSKVEFETSFGDLVFSESIMKSKEGEAIIDLYFLNKSVKSIDSIHKVEFPIQRSGFDLDSYKFNVDANLDRSFDSVKPIYGSNLNSDESKRLKEITYLSDLAGAVSKDSLGAKFSLGKSVKDASIARPQISLSNFYNPDFVEKLEQGINCIRPASLKNMSDAMVEVYGTAVKNYLKFKD